MLRSPDLPIIAPVRVSPLIIIEEPCVSAPKESLVTSGTYFSSVSASLKYPSMAACPLPSTARPLIVPLNLPSL